jgi:hypothetical protein
MTSPSRNSGAMLSPSTISANASAPPHSPAVSAAGAMGMKRFAVMAATLAAPAISLKPANWGRFHFLIQRKKD